MKSAYLFSSIKSLILLFVSMKTMFSLQSITRLSISTGKQKATISRRFCSHHHNSNIIICGDSTSEETYKKLFSSSSSSKTGGEKSSPIRLADALITDPPYCKYMIITYLILTFIDVLTDLLFNC